MGNKAARQLTNEQVKAFTQEEFEKNLKLWYERGSSSGELWYAEAHALLNTLADKYNLTKVQVAGFIALLSPQVNWDKQQELTDRAIAITLAGGDLCAEQLALGYYSNRRKAMAWLRGEWPEGKELSVKVGAFYRNLLGDETTVTVDTWAVAAAMSSTRLARPSDRDAVLRNHRAQIVAAYRNVATHFGTSPSRLQARVWTAIRSEKGK